MREEKYALQAQHDAEFQRVARANLEHGQFVRESQLNKARSSGEVFSSQKQSAPVVTPRQPDQAKSLIYGGYVEPAAKENNRNFDKFGQGQEGYSMPAVQGGDPYHKYSTHQQPERRDIGLHTGDGYSRPIQRGYPDYQEQQQQQQYAQPQQYQQRDDYHGNQEGRSKNPTSSTMHPGEDNVAAKYEEMLAGAALRRLQERTTPRSTSFY